MRPLDCAPLPLGAVTVTPCGRALHVVERRWRFLEVSAMVIVCCAPCRCVVLNLDPMGFLDPDPDPKEAKKGAKGKVRTNTSRVCHQGPPCVVGSTNGRLCVAKPPPRLVLPPVQRRQTLLTSPPLPLCR